MAANNSVSARTTRLNKLIVAGCDDAAATAINRETLLDAFNVLYNECTKDALKKNDSNIFEFVKKCKFRFAMGGRVSFLISIDCLILLFLPQIEM